MSALDTQIVPPPADSGDMVTTQTDASAGSGTDIVATDIATGVKNVIVGTGIGISSVSV